MKRKTTKKDFELFKQEVDKGIEYLGLFNWKVTYAHEKLASSVYARTNMDMQGMTALISLNTICNVDGEIRSITTNAKHEVLHLLLGKLWLLGGYRFVAKGELDVAEEEIVIILEKRLGKSFDKPI